MLTTSRRNARTGRNPPARGFEAQDAEGDPKPQMFNQRIAKRVRMASIHVVCSLLLLGLLGCQRELDMAKTYDDRNRETTIRYIGVREGTRQYADYSSIRGTILTDPSKTER